jgi:hypothetical protein
MRAGNDPLTEAERAGHLVNDVMLTPTSPSAQESQSNTKIGGRSLLANTCYLQIVQELHSASYQLYITVLN